MSHHNCSVTAIYNGWPLSFVSETICPKYKLLQCRFAAESCAVEVDLVCCIVCLWSGLNSHRALNTQDSEASWVRNKLCSQPKKAHLPSFESLETTMHT